MNKNAQALGRLGRGIPKNYTLEERERRRVRIAEARAKRSAMRLMKKNEDSTVK